MLKLTPRRQLADQGEPSVPDAEATAAPAGEPPPTGSGQQQASRAAVYLGLTRPRLGTLGLITVLCSHFLALSLPGPRADAAVTGALVLGGMLTLSGASALNQWLERHPDALMRRTAGRPLPTGSISPPKALGFGLTLSSAGLLVLWWGVNPPAAAWALIGILSYAVIYTPLKQRSNLNTLVGALPGAVPAFMGWVAARPLDPNAWILFAILALWQVPHFLSIARLYRVDYHRAGFQMLGGASDAGASLSRQGLLYAVAILPCTLVMVQRGFASPLFGLAAALLCFYYASAARGLRDGGSAQEARRLLRASVVFLPSLFLLLLIDRWS